MELFQLSLLCICGVFLFLMVGKYDSSYSLLACLLLGLFFGENLWICEKSVGGSCCVSGKACRNRGFFGIASEGNRLHLCDFLRIQPVPGRRIRRSGSTDGNSWKGVFAFAQSSGGHCFTANS